MNYFDVVKKENIGKSYEMIIDGVNKGIWELKNGFGTDEFELYREERPLSRIYFASQVIRMEFEEVIDWTKVPVDTKVLVSKDGVGWNKRHFAEYKDGKVYCFNGGTTSFTNESFCFDEKASWDYAKLYQE
jgi:hypothetical protein